MLSRSELVSLFEELEEKDVLSVYVNADEHDPAQRDAWRVRLDGEVSRLRRRLEDEEGDGVRGFDRAWERVREALHARGEGLPSKRGWVAFATADRLWYGEEVPASVPARVRWQKGIHAAPYIRALKQERPVTVVLVDARRARVFEQVEGSITEQEGILADTSLGDLTDVGMRKRSSRTSGTRGETATDQGQRLLELAAERMRKELAELIEERAAKGGIVVLGGPSDTPRRLLSLLPSGVASRVTEWPGLHLEMTPAEVKEATRAAAGDLSERDHKAVVEEVVDATRAGGKGALGKDETLRALRERRVDALFLSRAFVGEHPAEADQAVGLAFTQGADAAEVSGEAGALLDREGRGIAARLRYTAETPAASA